MAAFLPGSNVQAETVQTLPLKNPASFNACVDAAPLPSDANVNNQHQQSFMGYSMPIMVSHVQQRPSLQGMFTLQQSQSGPVCSRVSPYTWTNSTSTNEIPLTSSSDATPLAQVLLASKDSSMTPESQFSHSNMGRQQGVHERVTPGSNVAHALSLSLSPGHHLPTQVPCYDTMQSDALTEIPELAFVVGNRNDFKGDRLPDHTEYVTHVKTSSADRALATTIQSYMNDMSSKHAHAYTQPEVLSSGGFLTGSKYLKAVPHLLNEVVSVEDAIKQRNSSTKPAKAQAWSAHGDAPGVMRGAAEANMGRREGMDWGLSIAKAVACPELGPLPHVELTPQAKQELQVRKAKLMAMLEEVNRRYKLYHNQLQAVVSLFEEAAGVGAANCYTALAIQTISRHFRCLRDAITGQVRLAGKGLGEEEQQYLFQHRALQHSQMMRQHAAWRAQRGLPERAVSVLRAWLFEHFLHPYPKDADKVLLAKQTGLTQNQVSNWFINSRVRLWKPMVEEMYQEESKEADGPSNQAPDETTELQEDNLRIGSAAAAHQGSCRGCAPSLLGTLSVNRGAGEGCEEAGRSQLRHGPSLRNIVQNSLGEGAKGADSLFSLQEWQSAKKACSSSMDSFVSKTDMYPAKHEDEDKLSYTELRGMEYQNYGPYHSKAGVPARSGNAAGSALKGGNIISLTLGLQHSEPLDAQQQHLFFQHPQGQGSPAGYTHSELPDGLLEQAGNTYSAVSSSQNYHSSMAAATTLSNNNPLTASESKAAFRACFST